MSGLYASIDKLSKNDIICIPFLHFREFAFLLVQNRRVTTMSRKWVIPVLFILCVFALGFAVGGALLYSIALYRDGTLAASGNRFIGLIVGVLLITVFGLAAIWMFLRSVINTSFKKIEVKIPWFIGFLVLAVASFVALETTMNQWFGATIRSKAPLRSLVPSENLFITSGFAGKMYLVLAVFFVIIAVLIVVMLRRRYSKPKSDKKHSTTTANTHSNVTENATTHTETHKVSMHA